VLPRCRKGRLGELLDGVLAQQRLRPPPRARITVTVRRVSTSRGQARVLTNRSEPGMRGSTDSGWMPFRRSHGEWRVACSKDGVHAP
jgi:hypothetical protein